MPVAPKLPKLKPIAPEIDINNYYTVNMAMQAPKKKHQKNYPSMNRQKVLRWRV
ncbi:hypothetical protein MUB16_10650 [Priestia sp. OVL9]|nr:hypothetical protein [Priestia sp. OVL9]